MAFHPYLFFSGTCRDAFTRYQEIFGGELFVMPMSEAPSDEPVPANQAELIAHAALMFDGNMLMASDDPTGEVGAMQGMYVSWSAADVAEATKVFDALADGGEVTQPLAETFFSPAFGMCRDRFGTAWMVSTNAAEQPA